MRWPEIFTPAVWAAIIVIGFVAGIGLCDKTGKALGVPDHGAIVWDEIIAIWLVMLFVMPASFGAQLVAFLIFRAFDMIKPPPIRQFERRFKNCFGVMGDDLIAAFFTLLVLALWRVFRAQLWRARYCAAAAGEWPAPSPSPERASEGV
jgi:phosphatidylglycerophosphatase A